MRLHFHFSLSCIGEGNGNPLQYSCLENPRDGAAWWAVVYGVAQSRTRLKWLSSSSSSSSRSDLANDLAKYMKGMPWLRNCQSIRSENRSISMRNHQLEYENVSCISESHASGIGLSDMHWVNDWTKTLLALAPMHVLAQCDMPIS